MVSCELLSVWVRLTNGAIKQNRTADLFLTKEVLYQLSYNGAFWDEPQ